MGKDTGAGRLSDGLSDRTRFDYFSRAAIVNVMVRSSLTLTTPPTEMGLMPKSVCLIRNLPVAATLRILYEHVQPRLFATA